MDTFSEQLVTKAPNKEFFTKRFMIIIGSMFLCFISFVAAFFGIPVFTQLWIAIIAGVCYGGYKLLLSLNIEYEYIITNGDMDIDVIKGKTTRKRLCSLSVKNIEKIGLYNKSMNFHGYTMINAAENSDDENSWYFTFKSKRVGNVIVIFTPNERTLDTIKHHLSRQVLRECF